MAGSPSGLTSIVGVMTGTVQTENIIDGNAVRQSRGLKIPRIASKNILKHLLIKNYRDLPLVWNTSNLDPHISGLDHCMNKSWKMREPVEKAVAPFSVYIKKLHEWKMKRGEGGDLKQPAQEGCTWNSRI